MTNAAKNIALALPVVSERAIEAAAATLRSGWLGYGPRCIELESVFRGARGGWALATQSCTAAMWAVAMIAKSGHQPEIIIPANTYIACAAAFEVAGWRVRVCDVDSESGLLDLKDACRHLSPKTQALLIVDTYGQRFPEWAAKEFCGPRGLWLIRDSAHRLDLGDEGAPLSDFVCYSFGPTKEIPSPDGGLLWSSATELEAQARAITFWGISHDTWHRSASRLHSPITSAKSLGLKLRQTDVNAAIVLAQLPDWSEQRRARHALVKAYQRALPNRDVTLIDRDADDSCLMAPVLVKPQQRAAVRTRLAEVGISTSDHYPSLATLLAGSHAPCPAAEQFCASVIALPMHLQITDSDVARVAAAF
jgi:dTDP-4-amino-4,6-dideoxygalactose transaminase